MTTEDKKKQHAIQEMNHYFLSFIPEAASKKKWSTFIELEYSCFRKESLHFQEIQIYSDNVNKENPEDMSFNITIDYTIGLSTKVYEVHHSEKGISNLSFFILSFHDKYEVCFECCGLYSKQIGKCNSCHFFKIFNEYHDKKRICTICQDVVYKTMLSCGHCFHLTCLLQIPPERRCCPNCRSPFDKEFIDMYFHDFKEEDDDD